MQHSDKKLIVVGMRYQPSYYRGVVNPGDRLLIKPERDNKVNNRALGVWVCESTEPFKVGFIRDADLHKAEFLGCNVSTGEIYKRAVVKQVNQNYIVLEMEEQYPSNWCTAPATLAADLMTATDTRPAYSSTRVMDSSRNTETKNKPNTDKETTMNFNTNSIKDSFFREVKNVAFDITTGKLGVTSKDGISVYSSDGISVNPISDMGVSLPAFAMRVAVADLKEGDILIGNGDPVFFKEFFVDTKEQTTGYKTVSLNGAIQEVGVVTNMFFGKNTVLAVKNMFGESGSGDMNPMMLMAMSGMLNGSTDSKIDPMMLMMLMGGGMGGNSNSMNPMMLALMLSKK